MKKTSEKLPHVVVIHNVISPHITPVFQALAKKVHLTVLYCAESEDNRSWAEKPTGFEYQVLSHWSLKLQGKDLFTYFINPGILSALQKLQPDVVVIAGWDLPTYQITAVYCALKHIPYILWSGSTHYELSWRRTIARPLVQLIIAGASGFLAYGLRARDYLLSLGADPAKVTIAYNTTNLEKYGKAARTIQQQARKLKKQLKLEQKVTILYYGQLIERKGVDVLIRAFAQLKKKIPNAALIIVGSGPDEAGLKKLVAQLQVSDITMHPNPGDDGIVAYYHAADIFVLPSHEEVWGLVVNQAMVAGLPIIVSNKVGSATDLVIDGETGYVFPDGSTDYLTQKLIELLQDKRLRQKLGFQAKKRIQMATPEKVAQLIAEKILDVSKTTTVSGQQRLIRLIDFPTVYDDCQLSFAQSPQVPFSIARVYYMYDITPGLPRGFHAHKETQQVFVCIQGHVKVIVDDGFERAGIMLNSPAKAIFFDKMIWHEMYEMSRDSILVVFASAVYDPKDYIRDYDTFKKLAKERQENDSV